VDWIRGRAATDSIKIQPVESSFSKAMKARGFLRKMALDEEFSFWRKRRRVS
jgi:hypothetical protein